MSPCVLEREAIAAGERIVKSIYRDYCMYSAFINGRALLYKCIQYFTLFEPSKLGDITRYGFGKYETLSGLEEY